MKHPLTLVCALSLAAGLAFHQASAGDSPSASVLVAQPASPTCKPDAPIELELSPRDLVGGRARLDYTVTPVMDALAVEVVIRFPQGGNLRWHNAPPRAAAERGRVMQGALSADLPANLQGVELVVEARISIPDAEAPDGIGVYTTTRTATWGEVDRSVGGVTEVVTNGELSLDTSATRL